MFTGAKDLFFFSGVGDLSIWDFSGYEPYYMLYDHFMGDTNCINVIAFNLCDELAEQVAQVIFWLGFIKGRISPQLPLGKVTRDWLLMTAVI